MFWDLLWLLAVIQLMQAVSQMGFLLWSSFTAQPAGRAGTCHTPDTGRLFGGAVIFNIWIPSCEVVSRSKREFRLKGGEILLP